MCGGHGRPVDLAGLVAVVDEVLAAPLRRRPGKRCHRLDAYSPRVVVVYVLRPHDSALEVTVGEHGTRQARRGVSMGVRATVAAEEVQPPTTHKKVRPSMLTCTCSTSCQSQFSSAIVRQRCDVRAHAAHCCEP